ncbi:MAG TPA: ribosome-binding factor A [Candidatus Polarisedimenticolaceae bacterium]|nr:ribosome-binding factor A [Candidatus Polarisedimenticolaceae bacterium]
MSQRTHKVSSLIRQIVAAELAGLPESAYLTVTNVEVSPDLRQATVWIGIIAKTEEEAAKLFKAALGAQNHFQTAVARGLTTKFTPRLTIKHDSSGAYAEDISRLIKGL